MLKSTHGDKRSTRHFCIFLHRQNACIWKRKAYVIPCLSSRAEIPDSVVKVLSLMSFRTNIKATDESAVRVLYAYSDAFIRRWPLMYVWIQPSGTSRENMFILPHGSAGLVMVLHFLQRTAMPPYPPAFIQLSFIQTDHHLPGCNLFLHRRTIRPLGRTRLF